MTEYNNEVQYSQAIINLHDITLWVLLTYCKWTTHCVHHYKGDKPLKSYLALKPREQCEKM